MIQDKLIDIPSKSEKIEQHMEKMRQMFHPTPQDKVNNAIERTNQLLTIERNKKHMSVPLNGDSAADFERQVNESIMESTPVDDPIMEVTKHIEKEKPMQEESFPKFQWSIFLKNGRDEQLVVRANTFEEFESLRKQVIDKVIVWTNPQPVNPPPAVNPTYAPPAQVPAAVQPVSNPASPICGIHGVPMVWKTVNRKSDGKQVSFWSCSQRMPDNSYCKFKPQ